MIDADVVKADISRSDVCVPIDSKIVDACFGNHKFAVEALIFAADNSSSFDDLDIVSAELIVIAEGYFEACAAVNFLPSPEFKTVALTALQHYRAKQRRFSAMTKCYVPFTTSGNAILISLTVICSPILGAIFCSDYLIPLSDSG